MFYFSRKILSKNDTKCNTNAARLYVNIMGIISGNVSRTLLLAGLRSVNTQLMRG